MSISLGFTVIKFMTLMMRTIFVTNNGDKIIIHNISYVYDNGK